jgi:PhnB protein
MQSTPYLSFNGNCREALDMYQRVLGATVDAVMNFGDTPAAEHVGPDWADKVMHSAFRIGDSVVMASDSPHGMYQTPQGFMLTLSIEDPAEADRVYAALVDGGQETMPIQETFWALRFGMCTDKFGTPWAVNCEKHA